MTPASETRLLHRKLSELAPAALSQLEARLAEAGTAKLIAGIPDERQRAATQAHFETVWLDTLRLAYDEVRRADLSRGNRKMRRAAGKRAGQPGVIVAPAPPELPDQGWDDENPRKVALYDQADRATGEERKRLLTLAAKAA